MKKSFVIIMLFVLLVGLLSGCGSNKEQKVTCSICNGIGEVKYYFGDGDNDYNLGPCTSCEGKGYIMVVPIGDSDGGKRVICSSCYNMLTNLLPKKMPPEKNGRGVQTAGKSMTR